MTARATTAAVLVGLSMAATPLFASEGILIVQQRTTAGATQTSRIQIEKARMRAEVPGPAGISQIVIFDSAAQVMRMIDAPNKSYTELTKAEVDRTADQMSGAMAMMQERMKSMPPEQRAQMEAVMRGRGGAGAAAAPKIEYRKSGTDHVGKWTCQKYDGYQGEQKVSEICTVEPGVLGVSLADFEITKQMASFFQRFSPAASNQVLTIGSPDLGFSGVPVRSHLSLGARKTTIEITEVTRKAFADDSYAVPAGFQKRPSPFAGRGRQR